MNYLTFSVVTLDNAAGALAVGGECREIGAEE